MPTDGSLKFDTKVETGGMKKDLESVGTVAKGVFAADIVEAFAAKAGAALTSLAKGAIEVGANFETAMSQVAATMGITAEQIAAGDENFEKLSAAAKEMGATTKYTAAEAAEGLNILAMAGLTADEAIETLPSVLALAAAGAMDMGTAATYVTGAVKGYADTMDNAGKYADIMAKGATMANTDVNALGEAMSGSAASANAYGQSVETATLALLRLAEQNVTGSEAATAMNRAMADLYTPTAKGAEALKELGVATYEANGDARDFNDVVDDLNGALSTMSMEEKLSYENLIFTTFGMKAFQKMTVSTSETVEKFASGIEEASGSAMQQMNTQIDNLQGKLAILNSATESVGIAFYEIFEDTMKGAVDHASDAMTRFQKEMTSGRLSDSLNRLAKSVGNFADRAIDAAEDVLPALIDGLTWIIDHSAQIESAIVGIGSGFLVFKTVSGLMAAAQTAMALFSVATGQATAAQVGLNTAMMANPIGLVVAALAGLTAATIAFEIATKDAQRSVNEITDKSREMAEELAASSAEVEASAKKRSESFASMDNEAVIARNLAQTILELDSNTEKTAADQVKMQNAVDQLNQIFPELNAQIDENGRLTNASREAIEKNIESMIKQAKTAAAQEKLNEIAKEQIELEEERAKALKALADQQDKVSETQKEYNALFDTTEDLYDEAAGSSGAYQAALYDLRQQIELETKAEQELQDQYDASEKAVNDLESEYETYYKYIEEGTDATADAVKGNEQLADSFEETGEAASKMSDEVRDAYEDLTKSVEKTVESQTELFGDFDKASEVTFDNVKKRLEDQIKAMQSWSENIKILADRGINEGLLQELEEMGPEGAAYVDQFVIMTAEQLGEISTLYAEKATIEASTVSAVTGSWVQAATENTAGYIDGVNAATDGASAAGDAVAQAAKDGIMNSPAWTQLDEETKARIIATMDSAKEAAGEAESTGDEISYSTLKGMENSEAWKHLPLSVQAKVTGATNEATPVIQTEAEKTGEAIPEGIATGVENGTPEVETAVETMTKGAIDKINTTAGTTNGASTETEKTGENIAKGVASGIEKGTSQAETAGATMAKTVQNTIDTTLEGQYFYNIGKRIDDELARGLRENVDDVKKAASESGQAAKDGVSEGSGGSKSKSSNSSFENIGRSCIVDFANGMKDESANINSNIVSTQATTAIAQNAAAQPANITVENHVTLEGDANRLFTAIVNKNTDFVRTTGIAPLNMSPA